MVGLLLRQAEGDDMLNCQSDFLYVGGDAEQDAWLAEFPQQASTDKDKTEADPISQKSVFFPWT